MLIRISNNLIHLLIFNKLILFNNLKMRRLYNNLLFKQFKNRTHKN